MAFDEGFYANQARWIWETGDWVTPTWWGIPVYDRTIGIQWLIAIAYHLFGMNEFSARLPSLLACIASVLLTYEIGKILFNPQIAWLGALMLMFMALWIAEVHLATQTTVLMAIELAGILAVLKLTNRETNSSAWWWGIIAGLSVGMGFIIKGFMIFVPMVALLPYLIYRQNYRQLSKNIGVYIGLIAGWIPTLLWLGLSYQKYGIAPAQDLIKKLLFLSKSDAYDPGPLYYLWNLPANIFPWALFSAIGAWVVFKKLLPDLNYSVVSLTLGYPISLFILLSLFKTRMPYYAIQLLPFMALLAATAFIKFTQIDRQSSPRWYRSMTYLSYAFSGLGLILLIVAIIVISNQQLGGIIIPAEVQKYGISALILGTGWMSIIILWRRWQPFSPPYWLAGWLIPAWFAIASLGLQGAWTDKNHNFITTFQQPAIQREIANQSVNLLVDIIEDNKSQITSDEEQVQILETAIETTKGYGLIGTEVKSRSLNSDELKTLILLTFYTPHLGNKIINFTSLPELSYAWTLNISPQLANRVKVIAKVDEWQLIQKIATNSLSSSSVRLCVSSVYLRVNYTPTGTANNPYSFTGKDETLSTQLPTDVRL